MLLICQFSSVSEWLMILYWLFALQLINNSGTFHFYKKKKSSKGSIVMQQSLFHFNWMIKYLQNSSQGFCCDKYDHWESGFSLRCMDYSLCFLKWSDEQFLCWLGSDVGWNHEGEPGWAGSGPHPNSPSSRWAKSVWRTMVKPVLN